MARVEQQVRQLYAMCANAIVQGRADLDRELRANLLFNGFYENEEVQKNALNKFSFNDLDELYAAIGYGGITVTKVLNKIKDDVRRLRRAQEVTERVLQPQPAKKMAKSQSGVIVEGIENCLVKFARCCTPIPGDDIVGFVTRGYGVSIHRRDCVNVRNHDSKEEQDRWIHVWWDEEVLDHKLNRFSTGLQISTHNRIGVLSDVTMLLAQAHVNVHEISARDLNDGFGVTKLATTGGTKGVLDVVRTADGT